MLVKFRSKAAGDITMFEEHAKPILDLLNKDVKRGIITRDEASGAIARLEEAIAESKKHAPPEETPDNADAEKDDEEDENDQQRAQRVSFATRVYPLLEMLRAAEKGKHDVMWGLW